MENDGSDSIRSLFQKIQTMSVSEKLDLARKASKEARSILIRDSNKLVQLAVVTSPKITESEILAIASNRQVNDDVLKEIAMNKEWLRNYQIRLALVNNPKTPLSIAMAQVTYLNRRDLSLLAKSKGVPRPLIIAAQERVKQVKR
jgi:phosphoribosyl-dephospho-CoA transferase